MFLFACIFVILFTSCSHENDTSGSHTPSPIPAPDTTPPVITLHLSTVDITGAEEIRISGSELSVGGKRVASWTDNVSRNCQVKMTFDGVAVSSGDVPGKS